MARMYNDNENQVFVDNIMEYRSLIEGKSPKETKRITNEYAKRLVTSVSLISDRSVNGVAERLVYFDNLLAGVKFDYKYYLISSYEKYFGKLPRKNGSTEPNKWKTQHEGRRE
jgi:hypothetical protein